MPFDALVAPEQTKSLSEVLDDRGITPVSREALAAHQQAQLEKFAPSFWYRHQALLPTALLASVGCMAATGGMAHRLDGSSLLPSWLTLAWMCVIGLLIGAGVFRVRAGSHWEERWIPTDWLDELGVPAPIARLARSLHRATPGSVLIIGELLEERVVLDPYLLLERDGETVCLGIWDGGHIIACAE
jgi:hypothetical protein